MPGYHGLDDSFPSTPSIPHRRPKRDPLCPPIGREQIPQLPKNLKLPNGLHFLVDSREQQPYLLNPARVATLKTGDYSVLEMEDDLVVERKSLPDLLGCIAHDRERFERELERMAEIRHAHLVVEANLHDIHTGLFSHTQVHPNAVIGSLIAWSMRYGVRVWTPRDRAEGQLITQWILVKGVHELKESEDGERTARGSPP